jgi:hypothetical protein
MAKKNRYTQQQVIEALRAVRGMVYLAARHLQCDPDTIMRYCARYPAVEQAKHDARGELLDVAEVKLWQAVQAGEHWAICFALRTVGKDRGYGEHVALHLTVERAAARVAGHFGMTAQEVLDEAKLLLEECDRGEY